MSVLENRAIPFLLPLVESSRNTYDFSDEARSALTAWMMKMAMVWEHAIETKPKFFSAQCCATFKASLAPPPDVAIGIWIARRVRGRNIDQLFFQAVAQRGLEAPSVDFQNYDIADVLYRLWPQPLPPQSWPPRFFLGEDLLPVVARRIDDRDSL
jgi:hypothetical protein